MAADTVPWTAIKTDLEQDPAAVFAVSLDLLLHSPDSYSLGVDLVTEFAWETNPAALDGQLASDVTRLREALEIHSEHRPVLHSIGYLNFIVNVRDCGWELAWFTSDKEARTVLARIVSARPDLELAIRERPSPVPF